MYDKIKGGLLYNNYDNLFIIINLLMIIVIKQFFIIIVVNFQIVKYYKNYRSVSETFTIAK